MNNITCTVCGATDVPNWDGKNHCITCARDIILETTSEDNNYLFCASCLRHGFKRKKSDCRLHKLEDIVVSIG